MEIAKLIIIEIIELFWYYRSY